VTPADSAHAAALSRPGLSVRPQQVRLRTELGLKGEPDDAYSLMNFFAFSAPLRLNRFFQLDKSVI
jgi:hypothetical protein